MRELRRGGRVLECREVRDPRQRAALWRVREDGASLSSRLPGPDSESTITSWPGWEYSAGAPERFAGFRCLLDDFDLAGDTYGHFGVGCMDIRITFDQQAEAGRDTMT